jgi:hypothetical protein
VALISAAKNPESQTFIFNPYKVDLIEKLASKKATFFRAENVPQFFAAFSAL